MVLPAPFGPQEAEDLAATDLEIDPADCLNLPVMLDEPLGAQRDAGVGQRSRPPSATYRA